MLPALAQRGQCVEGIRGLRDMARGGNRRQVPVQIEVAPRRGQRWRAQVHAHHLTRTAPRAAYSEKPPV
jgi:hypothetical protein